MPITFGSVGDIIAVCVLVKDCVDALSDTNGSAPQYQAIIRELHILEKALLEIGVLSRTHATTPELTALFTSADTTIEQCRKSLAQFKAKIQPYDSYLGATPTKNTVQKICKGSATKLLWQVKMKDEVARFRAEVVAYSVSIDQILAAATMHTVKAQADRLDSRVEDLQRDSQRSFDNQDDMLKEIRTRLDVVDRRISAGNSLIIKLATRARKTWFMELGNELKALMLRTMAMNLVIFASVDKVHTSVLELRRALPTSSLVTPLSHERIFYLEDAIGRVSTITLDFITSYDALTAVLQVRFQGMPGSKKVLKKEYALQNRATGKDVDVTQRFEGVFLPGVWYNMSMIFQIVQSEEKEDVEQEACPRCGEKSNQPQGLKIKCSVCNQEYQYDRTNDSSDITNPTQTSKYTHAPDAPESFVGAPRVNDNETISSVAFLGSSMLENEADPDDDPANFNHVRIKTRRLRSDRERVESLQRNATRESSSPKLHIERDEDKKGGDKTPEILLNKVGTNKKEKKKPPRVTKATEEDARRAGIPAGYSYKNWDPAEEPIMLLGSVFDANSLGKWIYDWTVFYNGPATPLAEMAGELWLLLIQLAGKVKRAEETMPKIRKKESHEMVEDFLESGERLWIRFAKLLKVCEDYMWKVAKKENDGKKPVSMGKNAGREFVDSIFGPERQLEMTAKLMTGMRLWSMRFDAHCEDILRRPTVV